MKKLLLSLSMLGIATASYAGGFQLNLQGLRQLAMGGGSSAWVWDASTMFYNPGGLSRIQGAQANLSVLTIIPNVEYLPTGGNETSRSVSQVFTPFNLYVGGTLKKQNKIGLGLAVYTPFGSGLKWEDDWTGRYLIQEINLQSIFVQPTVSYKISDVVSIGGGFIYAFGDFNIAQAVPAQDQNGKDGKAELEGKAHGIGYNVGVHFKDRDKFQFGISYRSKVKMNVNDGTANFTVPASVAADFPNTGVSTTLPLPDVLTVGLGFKLTKKITLTADVNWVGWSTFDSLRFDFDQTTDRLHNIRSPREYKNVVAFRVGTNIQASEKFDVMLGYAYDPSPVHDGFVSPDLPDANRDVFTCGFAWKPSKRVSVLGALEYVTTQKRESSFDPGGFTGTYQTKAITPGLGIIYQFN